MRLWKTHRKVTLYDDAFGKPTIKVANYKYAFEKPPNIFTSTTMPSENLQIDKVLSTTMMSASRISKLPL